jgi:hypothetical protein
LVTNSTVDINEVIDILPGGGAGRAFDHAGQIAITALPASYLSDKHRINNNLFSQTLTLSINMGIKPGLGDYALQANKYLTTADVVECGSTVIKDCEFSCTPNLSVPGTYIWSVSYTPYHVSNNKITQAIYDALVTKNVTGLLALANSALNGTALPTGVTYSDLVKAVDLINVGFDGCRSFVSWSTNKPTENSFCTLPGTTTPCPPLLAGRSASSDVITEAVDQLKVIAYPNPYTVQFSLRIKSPVSGMANIEFYNITGVKVYQMRQVVLANVEQIVRYNGPVNSNTLLFRVQVGNYHTKGFAISPK